MTPKDIKIIKDDYCQKCFHQGYDCGECKVTEFVKFMQNRVRRARKAERYAKNQELATLAEKNQMIPGCSLRGTELFKALDDVKKLLGKAPYNQPGNICWGDGIYARSLETLYGKANLAGMVAYLEGKPVTLEAREAALVEAKVQGVGDIMGTVLTNQDGDEVQEVNVYKALKKLRR